MIVVKFVSASPMNQVSNRIVGGLHSGPRQSLWGVFLLNSGPVASHGPA